MIVHVARRQDAREGAGRSEIPSIFDRSSSRVSGGCQPTGEPSATGVSQRYATAAATGEKIAEVTLPSQPCTIQRSP